MKRKSDERLGKMLLEMERSRRRGRSRKKQGSENGLRIMRVERFCRDEWKGVHGRPKTTLGLKRQQMRSESSLPEQMFARTQHFLAIIVIAVVRYTDRPRIIY